MDLRSFSPTDPSIPRPPWPLAQVKQTIDPLRGLYSIALTFANSGLADAYVARWTSAERTYARIDVTAERVSLTCPQDNRLNRLFRSLFAHFRGLGPFCDLTFPQSLPKE